MSLKGTIKFSRALNFNYEEEAFNGDVRALYQRLLQIKTMYPSSKQIFFFFHTEDNILSCLVNGKRLTWFGKAIVPSTTGIKDFKGTHRVRNNAYSITIELGSTEDLI